ncbi:thymidylate synthase [Bacillus sp. FJAT-22090]|uniref:thymidylate synthase n=1 Tax=Bacillus sp. FJAT-22090 TaxID=1581038 RepID=UPI0011A45229|nr:thymidylate synthase [Bacillus sp. FJAT-22090]
MLNKAETYFIQNMLDIIENGTTDENPRPRYESDGQPAHTQFITQVFEKYDIAKGEIPITVLRPISIKNGINEVRWIYQDQTSELSVLKEKHNIHWWDSWNIGDGTIGQRYGATVKRYDLMNKLLDGLINDPFGRRHIINLWQEKDFAETEGLKPCAFEIEISVVKRKGSDSKYIDLTLTQRSSDYLVAGHINKMQYLALQMMIAKHCSYKVGNFAHFVQNLHLYDRQIEQAKELLKRALTFEGVDRGGRKPIFTLNVPDGTNFYDITDRDFKLIGYNPIKPNMKFDLGI